jgi:hypothetical protein
LVSPETLSLARSILAVPSLHPLALELELSLDSELELSGSSALLACGNSILNLSDTSSVEDRLPPLRDGVTGIAPLPLPVMLACLRCTII